MEKSVKKRQPSFETNCRFCSFKLELTENVAESLNPHLANHFRVLNNAPIIPITNNTEEFEIWQKFIGSKTNVLDMIAKLQQFALKIDQKKGAFKSVHSW